MNKFESMSFGEAIHYCYEHRDEFIRGHLSIDEGVEQFDGIIALLEYETIKPTDLPDYGME